MRRAGSFFLNRKLYISKSASAAVPFRVYHRNYTETQLFLRKLPMCMFRSANGLLNLTILYSRRARKESVKTNNFLQKANISASALPVDALDHEGVVLFLISGSVACNFFVQSPFRTACPYRYFLTRRRTPSARLSAAAPSAPSMKLLRIRTP